jgi:hypothetical protein
LINDTWFVAITLMRNIFAAGSTDKSIFEIASTLYYLKFFELISFVLRTDSLSIMRYHQYLNHAIHILFDCIHCGGGAEIETHIVKPAVMNNS